MTLLFDFDGTIANTFEHTVTIYNRICDEYSGRKVKLSETEDLKNFDIRELTHELGIPFFKLPSLVLHIQSEMKSYLSSVTVFPGLVESLELLQKRGHTLGIVTSNTVQNVSLFLSAQKIVYFDFIYGEKEYFSKGRKIKKVIQKHVPAGERVLYIGDEVRDIVAARQAGIDCVAVSWGYNSRKKLENEHPLALVSDPKQLAYVIEQL